MHALKSEIIFEIVNKIKRNVITVCMKEKVQYHIEQNPYKHTLQLWTDRISKMKSEL